MLPLDATPSVSVIGLGPMGLPIAQHLHAAGLRVTAWNRSPGPRERFAQNSGSAVASPAALEGDVVLSVLPDVDQLVPMLDLLTARPGRTLVVMSTSSPARMHELEERCSRRFRLADAPMSGGVAGAEAASLSIMVGAEDDTFARIHPVLQHIGQTVEHVGPLGAGMLAKLCNQVVVAGTLASLAEAVVLAEAGGIDLETLVHLFQGGLADSAVLRAKAAALLERDHAGGGSIRNQVKDLRYAVETARDLDTPAPVASTALDLFAAALAAGLGDADHSAVREVFEGRRGGG
jgi:2-hydroxy-3-oxopropionate reductase